MASVELVRLSKTYGALEVIKDVSLTIEEGEFIALVGPSGCGKSTLLRIIAGLDGASSGDVLMDGAVVNADTPRERNVAMVFQSYALYPHMTVRENLSFNLKLSRLSPAEILERITEAARLLELGPLLGRKPSQLSGGQRQRVAMGRAIVRNPALFLFDEPLSNLDAKLRVQMRSEIKALQDKVRTTSIYVTHDQIEAMTLADRIVVLNKGQVEQVGTPLDLYRRPGNMFVAGFIGSPAMNFLPATSRKDAIGPMVELADGSTLRIGGRTAIADGQSVTIGLRPEHLLPTPLGDLSAKVSLVEPTGALTHLHVDLAGQDTVIVVDGATTVVKGAAITVGISPDLVHVFDNQSGARLNGDRGIGQHQSVDG
jgi:multiple sugar transport system ATP-binding protein